MKPYIFLSENYLKNAQDGNGNAVSVTSLSNVQPPYTATIFFTDRYGNVVNRNIDTLVLQNSNVANMTVEAAGADGVFVELFNLSGNANSTVVTNPDPSTIWVNLMNINYQPDGANIEYILGQPFTNSFISKNVAVHTATAVKITIPAAGNPESVNIGSLGLHNFVCNLFALTDSNYKHDANQGGYRTVDGSYIHWADYKKWTAKIKMENVNKEQFDLLTAQADTGEITAIPYQDLEFNAIYECAVDREYSYELDRKTELFNLEFKLEEL